MFEDCSLGMIRSQARPGVPLVDRPFDVDAAFLNVSCKDSVRGWLIRV